MLGRYAVGMTPVFPPGEIVATADQRVVLRAVPWSHYEVMLALRGESAVPRLTYLEGALEITRPSFDRELIRSTLGSLVEAYGDHLGIELSPVGSWTIKNAPRERGAEADECYVVGEPHGRRAPDFAIEVVWTSGGLDKLDVWRGLGVSEVWIWKEGRLEVHALRGDRYELAPESLFVPGLDLALVARLATLARPAALRELRAKLGAEP